MKGSQKEFVIAILIIVVLLVIVLGVFFVIRQPQAPQLSNSSQQEATSTFALAQTKTELLGTWQSTDDPNSLIMFSSNGTYQEPYQDSSTSSTTGNWLLLGTLRNTPYSTLPDGAYLKMSETGSEDQYFSVDTNGEILGLTYLGRGNTNSYKKIEAPTLTPSLTCIGVATTTAELGDIINSKTSSPSQWLGTSSSDLENVKEDAGITMSDNASSTPGFFDIRPLPVSGQAWEIVATTTESREIQPYDLDANNGWQESLVASGMTLQADDWEGTTNLNPGVSGLIRQQGDCVQIIELKSVPVDYVEHRITSTDPEEPPETEVDPIPPYRRQYDVFLSDWMPISAIIQEYEKGQTQH